MIARTTGINRVSERGNVFLAIFGAIALVGLLGASVMTFMKGPLSTSVKLTKINTAENQMMMGAQVAVMATAAQANNGDCETTDPDGAGPLPAAPTPDGTVEPMPWRSATTEPIPTGGGLVPLSLGISKKDPWGTEYGYCVWNHGSVTSNAGCGANMLAGASGVGYTAYPVVALISAGPDKTFTTTCRTFAASDVNSDGDLLDPTDLPMVSKAAETDDDIITSYTYQEATGVSGGLWSLKAGDPTKATIGKNIETTGRAEFKGGLLLPDKALVNCSDITNAGVMAKNGTTGIEICDGAGTWTAITGGGVTGNNLVLTPNVSSAMNVTGGCGTATCYSTNVTFTLTNKAATTSPVLATALTNTTNFEFVSNGCTGATVAPNATCQMVVRAKASGNVSYAGTLQITGGNSPLATLDGVASGFAGCNVAGMAPGGFYVACGIGGYDLITTPSGCTSTSTNPICAGGADTSTGQASLSGYFDIANSLLSTSGGQNTVNAQAYTGGAIAFPAASYCDSLVYGGYSDWFLPSHQELTSYAYPNRTALNFANNLYWTSSSSNLPEIITNGSNWMTRIHMGTGAVDSWNITGTNNHLIRCMRWSPNRSFTANVDTTPLAFSFVASYGAPSVTRTSNTVTISRVSQPISISISGGTNARFSINGGTFTAAPTTVTNGDQIVLQATSPASGQENVVTLTAGSSTFTWLVRTQGNNILRVFTSAATQNGSGVSDANCTAWANAAGLPGSWMVLAVGPGGDLATKMPWNWNVMRNMNGQTVATSVADFLDGTIAAPLSYSQTGAAVSGPAWTGTFTTGAFAASNPFHCANWMTGSGVSSGNYGESSSTSGASYMFVNGAVCSNSFRLYCMEVNTAIADVDPDAIVLLPQVTYTSGGTGTSNTVTVVGVTDAVSVSITPSAGTADIIKNGASLGATSTTAGLNETLAFTLTAPTTFGQKNTATITIGPDTYTWWVGYADNARTAKIFITNVRGSGMGGGITNGDTYCNNAAAASPLGLSSSWKALLSNSITNARDRISWNWGRLETVTGGLVVNGGYFDLWDDTLDGPIDRDANGAIMAGGFVYTGSFSNGMKWSNSSSGFCGDWSYSDYDIVALGTAGVTSSGWVHSNNRQCNEASRIYCVEDMDNAVVDNIPNDIYPNYAIQVATSSRQTSTALLVSGMSTGATTTLSVSATGGTPTFKINGGAEVTSGTIRNGDSLVFLMDAPATGNSNNKMTITAGGSTTVGMWRVWTGDPTGTLIKRVFVTSSTFDGNIGGVLGADNQCQLHANGSSLGGTWKAIISGFFEQDWAINRVGYNWWKLRLVDGTDVVIAPNLWQANPALLSPIVKDQAGNVRTGWNVHTNTTVMGFAYSKISSDANCNGWTVGGYSGASSVVGGTSNGDSSWINSGQWGQGCNMSYKKAIYCIEQ